MSILDYKIVCDSSADIISLNKVSFASSPLKIISSKKEFIDDINLDIEQMINDLDQNKEKVSTACPCTFDWIEAFGSSKYIFCITITSGLSGSYNSACIAKTEYEKKFPDRKVCVIDSLSAGPELKLIAEKIEELILSGFEFDNICKMIMDYQKNTHLLFSLASIKNLKNNGRVSGFVAKVIGILGIRLIGKASEKGELKVLSKTKGEKLTLNSLFNHMKNFGYNGGKVKVSHCRNENFAVKLKEKILSVFKNAIIEIYKARGLCSFYAEKGGILIGFEG